MIRYFGNKEARLYVHEEECHLYYAEGAACWKGVDYARENNRKNIVSCLRYLDLCNTAHAELLYEVAQVYEITLEELLC